MPLKTCPDCGREVSTTARSYPNCGKALMARRNMTAFVLLVIVWLFGGTFIGFALGWCS